MTVAEYLQSRDVWFSTHTHDPAYTAQEVAATQHVNGQYVAKSVVVRTGDGWALCVLPAPRKLDFQKAATALKTRELRLAHETELAKLFPDVEVGAEPPFGNLYDMPTLVDEALTVDEEIVFPAGTHRESLRMKYADYARLVQPTVADLAVRSA